MNTTGLSPALVAPRLIVARWDRRTLATAALLTLAMLLIPPLLRHPGYMAPTADLPLRAIQTMPPPPPMRLAFAGAPPAAQSLPAPITPLPQLADATAAPIALSPNLAFANDMQTPWGPMRPASPAGQILDDGQLLGSGLELQTAVTFDAAPVPLARIEPLYPARARLMSTEGDVLIEFIVTADGRTAEARVLQTSHPGLFDKAALAAIARWRFQPARHANAPLAVRVRQLIQFRMDGKP